MILVSMHCAVAGFLPTVMESTMTLNNIPVFPDQPTPITERLEFCRDRDTVVYFFEGMPVFSHHMDDFNTFHMITAQFCVKGHATQGDIVRAFGINDEGVRLAVELYECMGADGFYPERAPPSRIKSWTEVPFKKPRKSKAAKAR